VALALRLEQARRRGGPGATHGGTASHSASAEKETSGQAREKNAARVILYGYTGIP